MRGHRGGGWDLERQLGLPSGQVEDALLFQSLQGYLLALAELVLHVVKVQHIEVGHSRRHACSSRRVFAANEALRMGRVS